MRVDTALNLVFEVERNDGSSFHVHSAPVSLDVFRKYNKPLAMAFADLTVGEQWRFAPTVAAMRLQQTNQGEAA